MSVTTFTRRTQTQDLTTGLTTAVVTAIDGDAIQVRGDPRRYQALGLVLDTMPTLLFSPTIYGLRANGSEFVQPGDRVSWANKDYTVKDVDPVAPDGVVIIARIVVGA